MARDHQQCPYYPIKSPTSWISAITLTDMAKQEAIERSLHTFAPICNVSMIQANLVRKVKQKGLSCPRR